MASRACALNMCSLPRVPCTSRKLLQEAVNQEVRMQTPLSGREHGHLQRQRRSSTRTCEGTQTHVLEPKVSRTQWIEQGSKFSLCLTTTQKKAGDQGGVSAPQSHSGTKLPATVLCQTHTTHGCPRPRCCLQAGALGKQEDKQFPLRAVPTHVPGENVLPMATPTCKGGWEM